MDSAQENELPEPSLCLNQLRQARVRAVPEANGGGELLTLSWLSLDEIASLDLPLITVDALKRLKPFLDHGRLPAPDCPASFQYYRGKSWMDDVIG